MNATPSRPSGWQFFKTFLRDRSIASVAPTSDAAVARICRPLDFLRPLTVIELGAGNGAFTRYLLSRLTPDSRLLAVELNPTFAGAIHSLNDPRLAVANDTAERLSEIIAARHFPSADAAISGIPFSLMDGERQQAVMRQVFHALKPGGIFIVYQFSPQVGVHLRGVFSRIEQFRVWRTLPPLVVYYARSAAPGDART